MKQCFDPVHWRPRWNGTWTNCLILFMLLLSSSIAVAQAAGGQAAYQPAEAYAQLVLKLKNLEHARYREQYQELKISEKTEWLNHQLKAFRARDSAGYEKLWWLLVLERVDKQFSTNFATYKDQSSEELKQSLTQMKGNSAIRSEMPRSPKTPFQDWEEPLNRLNAIGVDVQLLSYAQEIIQVEDFLQAVLIFRNDKEEIARRKKNLNQGIAGFIASLPASPEKLSLQTMFLGRSAGRWTIEKWKTDQQGFPGGLTAEQAFERWYMYADSLLLKIKFDYSSAAELPVLQAINQVLNQWNQDRLLAARSPLTSVHDSRRRNDESDLLHKLSPTALQRTRIVKSEVTTEVFLPLHLLSPEAFQRIIDLIANYDDIALIDDLPKVATDLDSFTEWRASEAYQAKLRDFYSLTAALDIPYPIHFNRRSQQNVRLFQRDQCRFNCNLNKYFNTVGVTMFDPPSDPSTWVPVLGGVSDFRQNFMMPHEILRAADLSLLPEEAVSLIEETILNSLKVEERSGLAEAGMQNERAIAKKVQALQPAKPAWAEQIELAQQLLEMRQAKIELSDLALLLEILEPNLIESIMRPLNSIERRRVNQNELEDREDLISLLTYRILKSTSLLPLDTLTAVRSVLNDLEKKIPLQEKAVENEFENATYHSKDFDQLTEEIFGGKLFTTPKFDEQFPDLELLEFMLTGLKLPKEQLFSLIQELTEYRPQQNDKVSQLAGDLDRRFRQEAVKNVHAIDTLLPDLIDTWTGLKLAQGMTGCPVLSDGFTKFFEFDSELRPLYYPSRLPLVIKGWEWRMFEFDAYGRSSLKAKKDEPDEGSMLSIVRDVYNQRRSGPEHHEPWQLPEPYEFLLLQHEAFNEFTADGRIYFAHNLARMGPAKRQQLAARVLEINAYGLHLPPPVLLQFAIISMDWSQNVKVEFARILADYQATQAERQAILSEITAAKAARDYEKANQLSAQYSAKFPELRLSSTPIRSSGSYIQLEPPDFKRNNDLGIEWLLMEMRNFSYLPNPRRMGNSDKGLVPRLSAILQNYDSTDWSELLKTSLGQYTIRQKATSISGSFLRVSVADIQPLRGRFDPFGRRLLEVQLVEANEIAKFYDELLRGLVFKLDRQLDAEDVEYFVWLYRNISAGLPNSGRLYVDYINTLNPETRQQFLGGSDE